jgi:hypothetical protein
MNSTGIPLSLAREVGVKTLASKLGVPGLVIEESPFSSQEIIVHFGQGFSNSAEFQKCLLKMQERDNNKCQAL